MSKVLSATAFVSLALLFQGCSPEKHDSTFLVRVKETRCLDGIDPANQKVCKGNTRESGIYEFRISSREKRALVRVVEQDSMNPSAPLFEIGECLVWDRKNWECATTNSGVTFAYSMNDGIYKHILLTGFSSEYSVGTIQNTFLSDFFK